MRFAEILDTTFSLYREHFLLFLGIISVDFFGSSVAYLLGRFLPNFFLKDFVTNLASMPFTLVSMGGIIVATATVYFGGHITSRAALKQAGHWFWHMLACQLPWGFVFEIPRMGFGYLIVFVIDLEFTLLLFVSVLLSVPFSIRLPIRLGGIIFSSVYLVLLRRGLMWVQFIPVVLAPFSVYFAVRWLFTTTAVLLERIPIRSAFGRSSELTRGRWWRVWGVLISFSVLSFAIQRIIEIAVGFILILTRLVGAASSMDIIKWLVIYTPIDVDPLFLTIMMWVGFVVRALIFPIWVIGITLLYFDLRIRKEEFEIEEAAATVNVA